MQKHTYCNAKAYLLQHKSIRIATQEHTFYNVKAYIPLCGRMLTEL